MFKKLKDKITEEVNPQRFQQLTQTVTNKLQNSSHSDENFFSIGDDDANTSADASGFSTISLNSPHRARKNSNSSIASDISAFLPKYDTSFNAYHLQSDLDVSEMEDNASTASSQLGHLTKEQIYSAFQKSQVRYHKYRGRYTDLAKHYKDLERENGKMKAVLVETQDKAIRRINELKEQCQLEQKAKAHLESALRDEIDEKQFKIDVLDQKLQLIQQTSEKNENLDSLTKYLTDARVEIEQLNVKLQEMKANAIVFQSKEQEYKLKIAALEKEVGMMTEREKENNLSLAQHKMELHNEILNKDAEISNLKQDCDVLRHTVEQFETRNHVDLQVQNKNLIDKLEKLQSKCKQQENELLRMQQVKQEADEWKSRASSKEIELEQVRNDAKVSLLDLEWKIKERYGKDMEEKEKAIRKEYEQRIEEMSVDSAREIDLIACRKRIDELTGELNELRGALEANRVKYAELEANHLDLIEEKNETERKWQVERKEMDEYRETEGKQWEIERTALENRVKLVEGEKNEAEERLGRLEIDLRQKQEENERIVQELRENKVKFEEMQKEIEEKKELNADLRSKMEKFSDLQEKLKRIQEENDEKFKSRVSDEELSGIIGEFEKKHESFMKILNNFTSSPLEMVKNSKNCVNSKDKLHFLLNLSEFQQKQCEKVLETLQSELKNRNLEIFAELAENKLKFDQLRKEYDAKLGEAEENAKIVKNLEEKLKEIQIENDKKLSDEVLSEIVGKFEEKYENFTKLLNNYAANPVKMLKYNENSLSLHDKLKYLLNLSEQQEKQCEKVFETLQSEREKLESELKNRNLELSAELEENKVKFAKLQKEFDLKLNETEENSKIVKNLEEKLKKIQIENDEKLSDEVLNEIVEKFEKTYENFMKTLNNYSAKPLETVKTDKNLLNSNNKLEYLLNLSEIQQKQCEKVLETLQSELKNRNLEISAELAENKLKLDKLKEENTKLVENLEEKLKKIQTENDEKLSDEVLSEIVGKVEEKYENFMKLLNNYTSSPLEMLKINENSLNAHDKLKYLLNLSEQQQKQCEKALETLQSKLKNRNLELSAKIEENQVKFDKLQKEYESKLGQAEENAKIIENLEDKLKKTQLENDKKLSDEVLNEIVAKFEEKYNNFIKLLNNYTATPINLQKNSENSLNPRAKLEYMLNLSEQQLKHCEKVLETIQSEKSHLETNLIEMETRNLQIQTDNKWLSSEHSNLLQQMDQLKCSIDSNDELQQLRQQLSESERNLDELSNEKQLLQDEIVELKTIPMNSSKLDNLDIVRQAEIEKYQSELEEVRDKLLQYKSLDLTNKTSIEFYENEMEKLKNQNEKLNRKLDETLVTLNHCTELSNSTEIEYLRNVLYNYMLGKESLVLARVIAAVCKFDANQTETILAKEQQKQTLLGHLGIL